LCGKSELGLDLGKQLLFGKQSQLAGRIESTNSGDCATKGNELADLRRSPL